jgi:hypothetical protein
MAASLSELLANIRATIPKIGTDRDLVPLHERLFAGEPGGAIQALLHRGRLRAGSVDPERRSRDPEPVAGGWPGRAISMTLRSRDSVSAR